MSSHSVRGVVRRRGSDPSERGPSAAGLRIGNVGTAAAVEPDTDVPAELLDGDEVVIVVIQPSLWLVPISAAGTLGGIALAILVFVWSARVPGVPWDDLQAAVLGAMVMALRLGWGMLEWGSRLYLLTDRRVLRRDGVLRQRVRQLPLREVKHIGVLASSRERALGIGTVVLATHDGDLLWEAVRQPDEVQRIVRDAADRYR